MAQLADGLTCGARRRRAGAGGGDGDGGGFVTRAPSNGTLAAVFTCAGRMGDSLRARQGRARGKVRGWGLLVMGDSPGFISLARGLPQLQGRVVDTADGGETGVPSPPSPPSIVRPVWHRSPPRTHERARLRRTLPRQPGPHGLRHIVHLRLPQLHRAHRRPGRRVATCRGSRPQAAATSPSGLDTPRQRHESQRRAASRLGQPRPIGGDALAGRPYQPMARPRFPHRRVDAQHARPLPRRGHRRVRLGALPTLSLSLALALPLTPTLVPIPCPN